MWPPGGAIYGPRVIIWKTWERSTCWPQSMLSSLLITWIGVSMSQKALPTKTLGFLRRNLAFAPRSTKEVAYITLVRPKLEYAAPIWALTQNFRLIRLRKFRGKQPAGPEGDGETRVVSAKCLMSLDSHLLRPRGTSPPCFSFTRFIVEQYVSIEKDNYMTPAHSLKTTRSSHSAQYRRHQTYSNALNNSSPPPELFYIGMVCLLLWPITSP